MSKKLKPQNQITKIKPSSKGDGQCQSTLQSPVFCFGYLTTNGSYNFDYFNNDKNGKLQAFEKLLVMLAELSRTRWTELLIMGKKRGMETIEFQQVHFNPSNLTIQKHEKMYIFQFDCGKKRIICYKSVNCRLTLHVVGFDFNFSAYDHGS